MLAGLDFVINRSSSGSVAVNLFSSQTSEQCKNSFVLLAATSGVEHMTSETSQDVLNIGLKAIKDQELIEIHRN